MEYLSRCFKNFEETGEKWRTKEEVADLNNGLQLINSI